MGAGVEHEIARLDETGIEPLHGGAVPAVAVIDEGRGGAAGGGSQARERPHRRAAADDAGATAGSASACSPTGAAVSSGRRPMPARRQAPPTHGPGGDTPRAPARPSPAHR